MIILAIDTTASPVSAALLNDGFLVGEFFLNTKTAHSQTLMPIVDNLLEMSKIKMNDIDVFAVNSGPGSFTGVRIGTAFVKGLSMPINKKCASVSTLEAMAYCLPYESGIVCAVMDARCSQVYNALFELNNGEIKRLTEDRALSVDELEHDLRAYSEKIYLVGDGALLCYKAYSLKLENAVLPPENIRFQRAYGTAKAAEKLAFQNKLISSDELMPTYLRLPQACRANSAAVNNARKKQ